MDVVFYSEIHNSGTSANMQAIAAICSIMKKEMEEAGRKREWIPMHFKDCGSIRAAPSYECRKNADILVASFPQRRTCLNAYFQRHQEFQEKTVYLISEYCEAGELSQSMIQHQYRMEEGRLGVIYFDNQFRNACMKGRAKEYVQALYQRKQQERTLFIKSLCSAADMLQRNCKKAAAEKAAAYQY